MAQTRGTGIAAAKRTLAAALGELEAAVEDLREDAENAAGLEEAEAAARAAMSRAVELEAALTEQRRASELAEAAAEAA